MAPFVFVKRLKIGSWFISWYAWKWDLIFLPNLMWGSVTSYYILGRTFNSTTTCLTRFWMHLGIRIRHIPKKVGKNIVFQCHETIEAAEILCYKFIKGQIELSLFLGKQPFSLTKCECRGLNDKNWLGKISFRPLHSHLVSENGCFPKKVTTRFVLL